MRSAYLALENEPGTNRTIRLDYVLSEYVDSKSAGKAFADIVESNVAMSGQRPVNDIGDEAWYHSDGKNFCLMMARKNNRLYVVKVNKMTKDQCQMLWSNNYFF